MWILRMKCVRVWKMMPRMREMITGCRKLAKRKVRRIRGRKMEMRGT